MQKNHEQNLARIKDVFLEKMLSWRYFDDGFDCHAYEINERWIFKIPRRPPVWEILKREKDFLDVFGEISPLTVPQFEFWGEQVLGYQKIRGQKLNADLFKTLNKKQKETLAKDLGGFLSVLHYMLYPFEYEYEYRNFFKKPGFDRLAQKIHTFVLPKVPKKIQENILVFLSEIKSDERNFEHAESIVHADLYCNHIYWDKAQERVSGIIDFGGVSKNAVTMDFTLLADFCNPENDVFLYNILSAYGGADEDLFRKIKVFAKLEKLYWPIEDIEDSLIMPHKLNDLEKSLEKVRKIFIH